MFKYYKHFDDVSKFEKHDISYLCHKKDVIFHKIKIT